MPWVTEDSVGVGQETPTRTQESSGSGDLRNADFPSTVGENESWTGTIDVVNVGNETETFKVTKDGTTKATFDLNPDESRTVSFSGTGPTEFMIRLMSEKEKGIWEEYRNIIIAGSVATVAVGYVATR